MQQYTVYLYLKTALHVLSGNSTHHQELVSAVSGLIELKSNALICHVRFVLVSEMVDSSEYLCSAGGKFCSHPTEFLVCVGNKTDRFGVILSHTMNKNIITLTNEIVDPIDEIIFQVVYESG
jgi:hypothetical protein